VVLAAPASRTYSGFAGKQQGRERAPPASRHLGKESNMDHEHDQEPAVCEQCGQTRTHGVAPPESFDTSAVTVAVRRPPLLELTTSNGRVWFIVNPN
jgi:hypothetical protein